MDGDEEHNARLALAEATRPRLRELMTFVVAGPLVGTLLIGLAIHRTFGDAFIGFFIAFSPMVTVGYVFGMPAASCAGIAWQLTRQACWQGGRPYRLQAYVTVILIGVVGGLLLAMMIEGPTYKGLGLTYMLHGAASATLCGLLAECLWVRTAGHHVTMPGMQG